jgi:ankyrin repeat protein
MARLLLDGGAAVDGSPQGGKTPLMFAAMFDRVSLIQLLVSRGADVSRRDDSGASALVLARAMGARGAAEDLSARLAARVGNSPRAA